MARDNLTPQQRRFIEAYKGNATEAAIAAGYSEKTAKSQGSRLLTNVDIANAIRKREEKDAKPTIADRQERQEFLTSIMRNGESKDADRLKASEILGKMNADFTEKREHSGGLIITWEDSK